MKKLTTLLLVLLTITLTGCGKSSGDPRLINAVNRLTEQFQTLQNKYDQLECERDELSAEIISLTSSNARLEQQLEDISSESKNTISSENQKTIDDLNSQIADLKKQLEDSYNNPNSTYLELQNKINTLNMDLQNYKDLADTAKNQVKDLQNQLADQIKLNSQNSSTATSSYLAIKFWPDGNTYSSSVNWYCDPNCTKSAGNSDSITITSYVVSEDKLSNGYTVYTCMSSGGLVYSSQYPYLTKNQ